MKRKLRPLLACVCMALITAVAAADDKRPITELDLFQFRWIGDPQITNDGAQAAFVEITVDDKRADYETAIWAVPTGGGDARRLTAGKRDSSPRWSPDGKYLAFLRAIEKDGKPQPAQLYVLAMQGGEPWQLTHQPEGVSQPAWSADGRAIAFLSKANPQDLAIAACESAKDTDKAKCRPLRDTDVKVITRAHYRLNNVGYLDFSRPSHIWSIAFSPDQQAKAEAIQLTRGEFQEGNIVWAPDGSRIFFLSDRDNEPYYALAKTSIYAVPASGGEPAEIARFDGQANALSVSPQGNRLAFVGNLSAPVQSHKKNDLWLLDVANGATPHNLTAKYDWEWGGGIIGDQEPPRAAGNERPVWSADGTGIMLVAAREGRANVERVDAASGAVTDVTSGDQAVINFASNGSQVVADISTTTSLNELYLAGGGAAKRLTAVNDRLFAALKLSPPQEIRYPSFDGRKIHALIQLPPDFDPKKKYPLILNIHGGPHAAYGHLFFHEMQWMAAKGYVVLYPNPRGSTSFGEGFANIIQYRYPGDDYRDLMAGIDEMLRRGYVDDKHMGVTGGSGGGLLTNWVIGHTDRFAAAVSQRDIADWAAWWYADDFLLFHPMWFKKPPFEDPADYRERSPITYIGRVKTPTMFILGDSDSRTPPETGGDEMFRALKYRKVPTVMVRFPGESHELSRSGKPWHRVERLQHIVNWFDLYLQGKKTNEYDLVPAAAPDLRAPAQR